MSGEKKHDPDSNKLGFIMVDNDVITKIVFKNVYLFIFCFLKNWFLKNAFWGRETNISICITFVWRSQFLTFMRLHLFFKFSSILHSFSWHFYPEWSTISTEKKEKEKYSSEWVQTHKSKVSYVTLWVLCSGSVDFFFYLRHRQNKGWHEGAKRPKLVLTVEKSQNHGATHFNWIRE